MEIDELAVKITGDSTSLQSAMRAATDAVGKLGIGTSALTGLLGAAGLAGAFKIAYDAADKMVQAYRSDETALLKYNAALAASTVITAQGKRALDEYVPVFATLSGIAEADTQAQIARLAAYGRTDAQIKTMMETALGMATVLDMDVNTALTQLNMTFSGTIGRLGQQIPALKSLTAEQLSNGEGVKLLNSKYGEFAGTLKNSTDVSIKNFENAWSDLMSTMGQSIAGTIQPLRDALTDLFRLVIDSISETNKLNDAHKRMADGTATLNDKLTVQVGILNNLKYARDSAAYDPTVSKEELADLDKAIAAQQKVVDELKNRITTEETAADTAKQAAATTASTQAAAAARQAKITEERTKIVTAYSAALENIARQEKIGLITAEQAGEARVAALDAQVVGLTNLIDALGLTTGATVDLRNAEELRLVTIKSQLEISKAAAIEAARIATVDSARLEAAARGYLRISQEQTERQKELMIIEGARMEAAARGYLRVAYSAEEAARITAEIENKALQQRIAAQHAQVNAARAALEEIKKANAEAEATRIMLVDSQRLEAAARGYLRIAYQAQELALEAEEAERRATAERAGRQHLELQEAIRSLNEQKEAERWRIMLVDAERWEAAARGYVRIAYQAEETENAIAEAEQKAMLDRIARQHLELNAARRAQEEEKTVAAEKEAKRLMLIDAQRWEAAARGYLRYENEVRVAMEKAAERTAEEERNRQGQIAGERYARQYQAWDEANRLSTLATEEAMARWKQSRADDLANAEQYYGSLVDIYRNLFDSIALETDQEKKNFLNALLAKVNAAQAAGATIQEISLMMALETNKFNAGNEIDTIYKQITSSAQEAFNTQIKEWEALKAVFSDDAERLREIEAIIEKIKRQKLDDAAYTFIKYSSFALSSFSQLFSGIGSLISAQADAAIDAVESRLERLKKSYGDTASELQTMYDALERMGAREKAASIKAQLDKEKAIEDYTTLSMEQLASLYATAIELGDDQAAAEITAAMARVKAEKDAAEEIKQIKYQAAVAEWNMKLMSTTASAAQAVMDSYKSMIGFGPVVAALAAAASTAFGITQIAAVAEAKPKLDTGGVIRAREETPFAVGKGTGEIMFGTSSLGDPLMQGFADLVASRVSGSPGMKTLLPVQIVLDGRVLAESTVQLIDDGKVRFRKPLKVAQR